MSPGTRQLKIRKVSDDGCVPEMGQATLQNRELHGCLSRQLKTEPLCELVQVTSNFPSNPQRLKLKQKSEYITPLAGSEDSDSKRLDNDVKGKEILKGEIKKRKEKERRELNNNSNNNKKVLHCIVCGYPCECRQTSKA